MCYFSCLTMNLSSLALINIFCKLPQNYITVCELLGYFSTTTSWMSFLWLNVLAFDIWSAFSVNYNKNQARKFAFYCLYAFGSSILMNLILLTLHKFKFISNECQHKIGQEMCLGSSQRIDSLIYTYLPIIYTAILNTILFSMTEYKLKNISISRKPTENDHAR